MSAHTIFKNTTHSILNEIDKFYICEADKYVKKFEYGVGTGAKMFKFLLINRLDDIISFDNCDSSLIEKISLMLKK
jgi:hypothetical protein